MIKAQWKYLSNCFFLLDCGESVLETLTDISHEYMLQMTRLLRRAVDNDLLNGPSGFSVSAYKYECLSTLHSDMIVHPFDFLSWCFSLEIEETFCNFSHYW